MNKVKTYPDRKQLIEFGRKHYKVDKPALIIERIADAMSQALASSGHRIDGGLLEGMRGEWDAGRFAALYDSEPLRLRNKPLVQK
ncbi:hypothetical protein [Pseudomonas sp. SWRI179]|uniref:hypothetical protein n=1 Tax=Pseudomonas sp. SWRI179 TaxID=2745497 RepID=UPI001EE18697|nr:hypothetical protein [Pseudomonas sp. SWRI179]